MIRRLMTAPSLLRMLTIIALTSCSVFAEEDSTGLEFEKTAIQLRDLYSVFILSEDRPELMLKEVNDTLLYGQFYPKQKFEIIHKSGEYYVPVLIFTDSGECEALTHYEAPDPIAVDLMGSKTRYLVPLSELPELDKLECIASGGIGLMTDSSRAKSLDGYYIVWCENYITGEIDLLIETKRHVRGGGKLNCAVDVDVDSRTVRLTSSQAEWPARAARPTKFLPLKGNVSFAAPADSLRFYVEDDLFHVVKGTDVISIRPETVCDNIVMPPTQERFPSGLFGVLFNLHVSFEGWIGLDSVIPPEYDVVPLAERESLVQAFEQIGAKFSPQPPFTEHSYGIAKAGFVNYVNWKSRRMSAPFPALIFEYEGDFEAVKSAFDAIKNKRYGMRLFHSHH